MRRYTKPPVYPKPSFAIGDRVRFSESSHFHDEGESGIMVVLGAQAQRCRLSGFHDPVITYYLSDDLTDDGEWVATDGGSDGYLEGELIAVTDEPADLCACNGGNKLPEMDVCGECL